MVTLSKPAERRMQRMKLHCMACAPATLYENAHWRRTVGKPAVTTTTWRHRGHDMASMRHGNVSIRRHLANLQSCAPRFGRNWC